MIDSASRLTPNGADAQSVLCDHVGAGARLIRDVRLLIPVYNKTEAPMDALAERLDARLRQWKRDTAEQVRQRVAEIIDLADQDALDVSRSRAAEQEVLDLLDEPTTR